MDIPMIFKMGPHMSEETSCYTMILSVSSFLTFQNCWISPLLSILPLLSIIAPSHFQSHHSPTGISSSSCGWCLHCYHWLGERELMKSLFKPQTVDDMMQCPGDGLSCVKVGKEPHGWRPHRLGAQKRVGFPDPKMEAPWILGSVPYITFYKYIFCKERHPSPKKVRIL